MSVLLVCWVRSGNLRQKKKSSPGLEKAMVLVLMMAGSSSFATPIGYQTNIMVMLYQ